MDFYDTQVISYAFKKEGNYNLNNGYISSIVANEFLLVYEKGKANSARYYLPKVSSKRHTIHFQGIVSKVINQNQLKRLPRAKKMADKIVLDFGNDFGTYVEYNNFSIASLINDKNLEVFQKSITHLSKEKQKLLKRKFTFLIGNDIKCIPVNETILDLAFKLLLEYNQSHNLKNDIRNSLNDLIIFATAISNEARLLSEDNELNKFVCTFTNGQKITDKEFAIFNFNSQRSFTKENNKESKGYINKGWKYKFPKKTQNYF